MDLIKGDAMKKPMPLYVKPDRLLSVRDVQNGMRDHFEGTDLDMTKDAGAGPLQSSVSLASDDFSKWTVRNIRTSVRLLRSRPVLLIVPQMRNLATGCRRWYSLVRCG